MTQRKTRITTPRGIFKYPSLTSPDTRFDDDGVYKVDLILEAEDAEGFIEALEAERQKFLDENPNDVAPAKLKKAALADLFIQEEDEDTGEETGRLIFRTKQKAIINTKKGRLEVAPRLFDAKGKLIEGEVSIWSGTEGKLSVDLVPYYMASSKTVGVSLRLQAAQILKLVSGGGSTADSYGFGEEDGYEMPEDDNPFEDTSTDASDDGDY